MAHPLSRTLQSLPAARTGAPLAIALVTCGVLAALPAWATLGRVEVVVASRAASLRVESRALSIQAPRSAEVAEVHLGVDRAVTRGDVLVTLDARAIDLELASQRKALEHLRGPQQRALDAQIEAAKGALDTTQRTTSARVAEQRAALDAAQLNAEQARRELARLQTLLDKGVTTAAQYESASARAARLGAEAERARRSIARASTDGADVSQDRASTLAALERERVALEREAATLEATIDRLEHERARHVLTAPHDGVLNERRALSPGATVERGEVLATLIAPAPVRAEADVSAARALGLVERGQPAVMRLDGFPWTRHGVVHLVVDSVESDPRDDTVRIRLDVDRSKPNPDVLRHGLTGEVEIVTGAISPWQMALRAAGLATQEWRQEAR